MSGVAGLRGVSAAQDGRFSDKTKQLQQQLKFPKQLDTKIDFDKVNLEVIREWVAKRVTALLNGLEDDVLIGFIFEMLEQKSKLDPRELQIYLTGFLEKNTSLFMKELWTLLIEAQQSEHGIPQQLLDLKAEELRQKQKYQEKIKAQLDRSKTRNQDGHTSQETKRSGEERRGREVRREREAARSRSRELDGISRRYRSPPQFYRPKKEDRYKESYYRPRHSRRSPSPQNKRYPRESSPRYRSKSPSPVKRQPRSVSPRYRQKSHSPNSRQSYSRSHSPSSLSPPPTSKPRMQLNNEHQLKNHKRSTGLNVKKQVEQQEKGDKEDIDGKNRSGTSPDPVKEKLQASMSPFNDTSRPLREGAPSPSTDKDPSQQKRPIEVDPQERKVEEVVRQKRQRSKSGERRRKKDKKESSKKKHKKDKKSKSKKKRARYNEDDDGGRRRDREYDSQRSSSREKVGDIRRDINDIVQEMKSIVEVEDLQALRQKALRGMRDDN
eukprot:TRINITY_DN1281_c0_g3_i1.p1 TRINITY_DN1281_c0_g3~~TRINITY_DN1281_c0_g3_i1.p1  ORF type:complete len:494 (-),score=79.48 TRINITY_DN1281_c0_g3_i1:480-1961(-)